MINNSILENEQVKSPSKKLRLLLVDDFINNNIVNDDVNYQINDAPKKKTGKILYTYDYFMEKTREVHGDKFNYSKVTKDQVNGVFSTITIICNNCKCEEVISISNHLNNKGCKKCKHKIINNKIDESSIIFNDLKSEIICNNHNYEENVSHSGLLNDKEYKEYDDIFRLDNNLNKVINNSIIYDYDFFMEKAKEIHGNKFDYCKVFKNQVNGIYSNIIIICNKCGCEEEILIVNHLRNNGCKKCKHELMTDNNILYNYDYFIKKANEIHSNKFDYSKKFRKSN